MTTTKHQQIAKIVKEQGYYIDIDKWPKRLTYYKPDGEGLPHLPADPWSMERYLKRGFTLVPPELPIQPSDGGKEELAPLYVSNKDKQEHEREIKTEEKVNA